MESLCWSWLLAGAVAHGEDPMQEQVFWQQLCHPLGTHTGAVLP